MLNSGKFTVLLYHIMPPYTMKRIAFFAIFTIFFVFNLRAQEFTFTNGSLVVEAVAVNGCNGSDDGEITFTVTTSVGSEDAELDLFNAGFSEFDFNVTLPFGVPVVVDGSVAPAGLPADTYSLLITSDNSGGISRSIDIFDLSDPVITTNTPPTDLVNDDPTCAVLDAQINVTLSDGSIPVAATADSPDGGYVDWTITTDNGLGPVSGDTRAGTTVDFATELSVTALPGGTYTITITDQFSNCNIVSQDFVVTDPKPNPFTISTTTNPICDGDDIIVTVDNTDEGVTYEIFVAGAATGETGTGPGAPNVGDPINITLPGAFGYTNLQDIDVQGAIGGCTSVFSTNTINVTVNPLPTPTITGTTTVCFDDIENYTTEAGQTNYAWTVNGGTVTAGGAATDDNVTVQWDGAGPYSVEVNYDDANGCTAAAPTSQAITVNPLPTPTITGTTTVCFDDIENYTTEAGQTNYAWTVNGGTVTAGGTATDDNVTIQWDGAGPYSVEVNYDDGNGCTPATPTSQAITVNPLPTPTITGTTTVCFDDTENYTTEAGQTNYAWTVNGGTVTAGGTATDDNVTVQWDGTGPYSLEVNYDDANGCSAATATAQAITVNPQPNPTITGATTVCFDDIENYTTEAGQTNYVWTVNGGTVTAGGAATDDNVSIQWDGVGPYSVEVNYEDANGCSASAATSEAITVITVTPTISGTTTVCFDDIENYTTEAGQSNYVWTVNGGTVTAGGAATDDNVTVQWDGAGPYSVEVNYQDINGCTAATPTSQSITVNPLPTPTITGTTTVCFDDSENYTTEAGQTNYVWTVNGGTITAGGTATDDNVTVQWDGAGPYSVEVNYEDTNGCSASTATSQTITVNPLPTPTITGTTTVCFDDIENYTTEAGQTNYAWTVNGGTVTAGGAATDDNVTVQWDGAGPYSVEVNYDDANGCTAAAPTSQAITVNPLPTPTITGTTTVCFDDTENYTTEVGQTNYAWTVNGGTVTAGGTATDDNVTIQWDGAGPYSVEVNYDDGNGCTAATPTSQAITVNPLPTPTITGTTTVCFDDTENYTTEAGQSNYVWTVNGGTVTAGGTATDDNVTVQWDGTGPYSLEVNYDDANGCSAATATAQAITVNPQPNPTITGATTVCFDDIENYTTEAGQTNYVWTVNGGTVTAGGAATDDNVTIQWDGVGPYSVEVNYEDANGCSASAATSEAITVITVTPTISGTTTVCFDDIENYTTEAGQSNYVWTVNGGTITAGGTATDDNVTVQWDGAGPYSVEVNYQDINGCTAATPTSQPITVNPLPTPTITGTTTVCFDDSENYTTEAGQTNYVWIVNGGTITAGGTATDDNVTVQWDGAGPYSVEVNYEDANGCSASTATSQTITVNPLPTPTITGTTTVCFDDIENYTTEAGQTNYAWTVNGGTVTAGGAATDDNVTVQWDGAGPYSVEVNYDDANGCTAAAPTSQAITVNPLPTPTITGTTTVCFDDIENYTTEAGQTNYAWTVNGGTVTAGGTATDDNVTIQWDGAGPYSVEVNYDDGNGCTAATATSQAITVNPLPTPTITGTTTVCFDDTENYTTEAGQTNYVWTVNGGTVTAGGAATDDNVTVQWDGTGPYSLEVNYDDANGCSAATATAQAITVNPLPTPTISGVTTVCMGDSEFYNTEAGQSNYNWTVTGGTIVVGGAGNTIAVEWNGAGPTYEVSVNYEDANGCTAATPTTQAITVVNPNLTLSQSPDPGLCPGASIELTASAGFDTYEFRDGVGGPVLQAASADNTFDATIFTDGQEIEVEAVSGVCGTITETIIVNVDAAPSVALTQSPDPGCAGSSVELTATAGFDTYEFRDGVGGPVLQAASADNTFDATTFTDGQEIEVEAVSATCGTLTTTILMNIVTPPTLTLSQSPDPGCDGSLIEITASAGFDTYEFRDGVGGPVLQAASADNTFDASNFTDGQVIEVEGTTATCGIFTETISLNVTTVAALALSQSPDPGTCPGASIEITATTGYDTYEFRDGVSGPVLQAASADNTFDATTFTDGQIIEVEAIVAGCGSSTETITINVSATPALTLTQTPDPGLCPGSSIEVSASVGFDTYEFRDGVSGPVLQAASADNTFDATTFTDGQIIEVEAISATCGTVTETITMSVNAAPSVTLSQSPDPGCAGASIELTATTGFDTYEFRDGIGGPVLQVASADNTFDATTFTNGQEIEVEAVSASCGTLTTTINVNVTTVASLTLSQSPDPGCVGNSLEITASLGFDTYEFRDGVGGPVLQAASADNTFDATTFTNGQEIEVEAVSAVCGTTTSTITLSLDAVPALSITQNPDPGLCVGSSVELTAIAGYDTYEFRDGVSGPVLQAASADNTFDATTFTDGQVIEVEAISAGCGTFTETITVNVNAAPTVTLSQSPDPVCQGLNLTLTATTGFDTYEFRDGVGGPILQAASASNTFTNSGLSDGQEIEVVAFSASCGSVSGTFNVNILPSSDPSCGGGGGGGPICSSVTSLSISNVVNPDCGLENGSLRIDATFSPAQSSVIYGLQYYDEDIADSVFNTQLNNPDFTDLAALNYRYFVTAGVDTCFLNFNLAPKTSVNADIVAGSLQNVTCFGQPSGSLEVENLSGSSSGDYFYSINGGTWTLLNAARIPNASDPNGLVSGINVIRVGDMINDPCPARLEVSVANTNPMITFNAQVDQNLTTCDSNDGEISVDFPPSGGANGSGDDWFIAFKRTSIPVTDGDFGLFSEDVTFNNLVAESYTVYIRDISSCTVSEQFDINAPGTIDLSATVSSTSCTDVDEGRITLTVDNRSTLNTQFEVTIVDQDNPSDTLFNINDGWTGGTRVFPPITETGLVSGDYIAFVSSEGTGICEADTLFTVSGGPVPVSFDTPVLSCGNNGDSKQLVLSNIQGDNSVDYTLRVTEGPTEIMTETFTLSGLDDEYEVMGTAFLNQPADYDLELIQSQPQCTDDINSGKMILRVEENLNASITILSSSAPDLASGSYRVEVENETGVAPYVVASDFVTQTKHPDYVLTGNESSGPDTLTFNSIEDRFEIVYEGKPTGEYEIMVMDAQGCIQPQPQPFLIEIPLDSTLFIPNIFTPNNDDLNDFFKIRNLKEGSKLLITNRWGNEIFRSDNYSNETAWDGEETPDGVYYYRLESPDGQIYTGWVEILRGSSP